MIKSVWIIWPNSRRSCQSSREEARGWVVTASFFVTRFFLPSPRVDGFPGNRRRWILTFRGHQGNGPSVTILSFCWAFLSLPAHRVEEPTAHHKGEWGLRDREAAQGPGEPLASSLTHGTLLPHSFFQQTLSARKQWPWTSPREHHLWPFCGFHSFFFHLSTGSGKFSWVGSPLARWYQRAQLRIPALWLWISYFTFSSLSYL